MGVFDSSAARIAVVGVAGTDVTESLVAKLEHAGQVETHARPQPLTAEDHDVWVVDYDCLEGRARREWTNKLTGDPARRSRALFMSGAATMDTLAELLGPGLVSHLAANNGGDEDSVLLTVRKMLGPVAFGLGQYIPAPTSSKLFTVDGSGAVRGL